MRKRLVDYIKKKHTHTDTRRHKHTVHHPHAFAFVVFLPTTTTTLRTTNVYDLWWPLPHGAAQRAPHIV